MLTLSLRIYKINVEVQLQSIGPKSKYSILIFLNSVQIPHLLLSVIPLSVNMPFYKPIVKTFFMFEFGEKLKKCHVCFAQGG